MCGFLVTPLNIKEDYANFLFDKYVSYRGTIPKKEIVWNNHRFQFARLPIVDINSFQNQPYIFDNNILVFNGELYNYLEIKEHLIKKYNLEFKTDSDSEVFLKAFLKLGPKKFFSMAAGMWAYVISDKNGNFYWGRDEFGVKPLFYLKKSFGLYFSSSQKALVEILNSSKSKINKKEVKRFIVTGYQNPNQNNFYNGFNNIYPGFTYSFLFEKDLMKKEKNIFNNKKILNKSLRDVIEYSFTSQYPKEVSSTLALSGGLDSSLILHLFKSNSFALNTLSLDLNSSLEEKELIKSTINQYKCEHMFVKPDKNKLNEITNDLVFYLGQPLRSSQPVYQYLLRERASEQNSKVFFTGDGSDEIFGGYKQGFYFFLKQLYEDGKSSEFLNSTIKEYATFLSMNEEIQEDNIISFIEKNCEIFDIDLEWKNNFKYNFEIFGLPKDFEEYCEFRLYQHPMPYWLLTEDLVSLLNGLETRIPFLDQRVVLKSKYLDKMHFYKEGTNKYNIRKEFSDLPDHILEIKKKLPRPADTDLIIFDEKNIQKILSLIDSEFFREMFGSEISSLQFLLKSDNRNNYLGRSDNWFRLLTTQIFLSYENII